ncbi:MAG: galactokinase [Sedimentisphaerales bacterium]
MTAKIDGQRPISDWIALLKDPNSRFYDRLDQLYGGSRALKSEAAKMCLQTLEAFAKLYGPDRSVIIVRSTGRVNLLGTHIDHRGGSVNAIAVKHIFAVVEPRDDDLVLVKNVESKDFPNEQFRTGKCLPAEKKIQSLTPPSLWRGRPCDQVAGLMPAKLAGWDAWCHDEFEKRKADPLVTWSNYIRAAVLYLQHLYTDDDGSFSPAIKGMNMMVYGNVPRAAGLSSSSALVMLAAEAVRRINSLDSRGAGGLQIEPADLIEHCGYAEWYVGTRGGCSDHAAITFGKSNAIVHITNFPVTVETIPFPVGYKIILANSLIEAKKQTNARNTFNSRVAAYEFGLMMIRKNFPQYADKLQHLRDVNPQKLGVDEAQIYRIIKSLPTSVSRVDILKQLGEYEQEIRHIFRSHDEPQHGYQIRQICLYGIAECIRADMAPQCLRKGDMKTFGELLCISHDGDRVTKLLEAKRVPINNSYPDERIDALISDLQSRDPHRMSRAHLWRQSGGYNVSLPEIDTLVDIALASPGVIGAGLVGAGMGGCIVAVAEDEHARQVIENMASAYYRPRNLPVAAEIITPTEGLCSMDV